MQLCRPFLFLIFLLPPITLAQSQTAAERCKDPNDKLSSLTREYKNLRERRKKLPAGKFDADLSGAGGKLSKVLSRLGNELGHPPFTKDDILTCMGEPDAIEVNDKHFFFDIYKRELEKKGMTLKAHNNREFLIYHWRGWHDFLFFISEDDVIVDHGWWFAYE